MAFDLLYCDRRDLTAQPLRNRRARPEDIVANSDLVFPVRRPTPDGLEAWKQVIERGYEGYVAKDEASAYQGGPTRRWLKVKQAGWTVAEDRWQRRISAMPPPRHERARARRPQPGGTPKTCPTIEAEMQNALEMSGRIQQARFG
jgi:ATP dependent DNA ligase-like protein